MLLLNICQIEHVLQEIIMDPDLEISLFCETCILKELHCFLHVATVKDLRLNV